MGLFQVSNNTSQIVPYTSSKVPTPRRCRLASHCIRKINIESQLQKTSCTVKDTVRHFVSPHESNVCSGGVFLGQERPLTSQIAQTQLHASCSLGQSLHTVQRAALHKYHHVRSSAPQPRHSISWNQLRSSDCTEAYPHIIPEQLYSPTSQDSTSTLAISPWTQQHLQSHLLQPDSSLVEPGQCHSAAEPSSGLQGFEDLFQEPIINRQSWSQNCPAPPEETPQWLGNGQRGLKRSPSSAMLSAGSAHGVYLTGEEPCVWPDTPPHLHGAQPKVSSAEPPCAAKGLRSGALQCNTPQRQGMTHLRQHGLLLCGSSHASSQGNGLSETVSTGGGAFWVRGPPFTKRQR